MKKLLIILSILISINVNAKTSINVTIDKKKVATSESFNVKAHIKASPNIGTLHYEIIYNKEALKMNEGSEANIITAKDNSLKDLDINANFIALKEGKQTISINIVKALSFNMQELDFDDYSYPVSVEIYQGKTLSSNNFLKDLKVKDENLSFKKDTFSYNLITTKDTLDIEAITEDSKATSVIEGNKLHDGNNTVKIKVYAENGVLRLYEIKALKKPSKKIKIKYHDKDYYISPTYDFKEYKNFTKTRLTIDNEKVDALYNEDLDTYIIHIFNDHKNFNVLYKNKKLSRLTYIEHSNLYLMIKEYKGRHSEKVKINDKEYSLKKAKGYYYFYAYDLEEKKENIYRYDGVSIQKEIKKQDKTYLYIIITVIILNVLGFIFLSARRKNG